MNLDNVECILDSALNDVLMIAEKSRQIDLEHIVSLLQTLPKSVIHIRQISDRNDTIEISAVGISDDVDHSDPLRIPEVIIVIAVLLLWCGAIWIFIRHSELLRIRHRDLPYRSPIKSPIALNPFAVVHHASDLTIQARSRVSSMVGLTPPTSDPMFAGLNQGETNETISLIVPPMASHKRRHTHSFDFPASGPRKYPSERINHTEHFLHPHRRISSSMRQSFLTLHRQSMDNVSTIKHPTQMFYSAYNILRRKSNDNTNHFLGKNRGIHESPV